MPQIWGPFRRHQPPPAFVRLLSGSSVSFNPSSGTVSCTSANNYELQHRDEHVRTVHSQLYHRANFGDCESPVQGEGTSALIFPSRLLCTEGSAQLTYLSTIRPCCNTHLLNALRRSVRDDSGSALVEAGISMIVLLMLIFGVIQVSWAVYSYHLIANAAHEGARYAIVRGGSWTPSCDGTGAAGSGWNSSQCAASTADIANYVASRSLPGVGIVPSNVCVRYSTSVSTSAPTSCTPNTSPNGRNNVVQVTSTILSFSISFGGPTRSPFEHLADGHCAISVTLPPSHRGDALLIQYVSHV